LHVLFSIDHSQSIRHKKKSERQHEYYGLLLAPFMVWTCASYIPVLLCLERTEDNLPFWITKALYTFVRIFFYIMSFPQ
jgi:hypothetical protein